MHAPRAAAVAVCGLGLLVAGCGSTASRPPREKATLQPCRVGGIAARCGTLRVPEDPARADGRRIPVRFAVVPAREPRPRRDPLLYLSGWGSAGVQDDLAVAVPLLTEVNRSRDVIFVDQRGTGASNRLSCGVTGELLARGSHAAITDLARRCAARIGPSLRFYTSAVAVDDFDRVRAALGYDTFNLYGISYGGTLAQIYLGRHPEHVRSVVLDGASLLDVHIFERGARNAQRALDRLFARCRADAACHAAFPDPQRDYDTVAARVAREPLTVPGSAQKLDPLTLPTALDDLLAYTQTKPMIPRLLHLLARGRLSEAARAVGANAGSSDGQLAYQQLIQCSEPWASWRPAEVRRDSRGTFMAPPQRRAAAVFAAFCRDFPEGVAPADVGRRVRSRLPVLLLTGQEDSADPPANVVAARRELPNSRTVIFAAAGHGQLGLPCAQRLLAAFVERASASGLDVSCARTAARRPFDTRR